MKKFSFLVFHKDYAQFLERLQELGLLHVIMKESAGQEHEKLLERYQLIYRLSTAIRYLDKFISEKKEVADGLDVVEGMEILDEIENIRFDIEMFDQKKQTLRKDIQTISPWGDFTPASIKQLKDSAGITVRLFKISVRKYNQDWEQDYCANIINQDGNYIYFAAFTDNHSTFTPEGAEEFRIPEHSLSQLQKEFAQLSSQETQSKEHLMEIATNYAHLLPVLRRDVHNDADYVKVIVNSKTVAEEKVFLLNGWVPESALENITKFAENEDVVFFESIPDADEKTPILLKNNGFNKLFEPIGKLYSLPHYSELDLTPFFAPFYMLFFGFCMGDAGYGLLLLVVLGIIRFKAKAEFKPLITLALFLSLSTVVFGIIGGTFFGIDLYATDLPIYSDLQKQFKAEGTSMSNKLFYWAIGLGAVQTLFGMCVKVGNIIKQSGIRYALPTLGWIVFFLTGASMMYLQKSNPQSYLAVKPLMLSIMGAGGILVFFFNNPKANVFINFGSGIWDAYSTISGVFGDLLSYIRLFALGVSSAILGSVFNQIAVGLSPDIIILEQLVFAFILIFGHGINIFMSALGSFVHPMRLTFVEFYKNAGFNGGGKAYRPFQKTAS